MKINFWKLFAFWLKEAIKKAAVDEIDKLLVAWAEMPGTTGSLEVVRNRICNKIQEQRKVPGELRGALCQVVWGVPAQAVPLWLTEARRMVQDW